MNKMMKQSEAASETSVSRLAYQLWETAGRPAGRDLEFWLAAEAKVRAVVQQPASVARAESAPAVASREKTQRATRPVRGGTKKAWPKPYPSLPRF